MALVVAFLSLSAASSQAQEADRPPASSQQNGPVTPDSADVLRASLERPPAKPPFDALDAAALPFKIVFFPLRLLGRANVKLVGLGTRLLRPREYPLLERLADAGFRPRFGSIGPRSGIGAGLRFDRWSPLFLESAISIRGSQHHEVGLELDRTRYRATTSYAFRREAEPHFWGVGPKTSFHDRRMFLWDHQTASLLGSFRRSNWAFAAGLAYQDNRVAQGFDDNIPPIQDWEIADTLYGVSERTKYAVLNASATLDHTLYRGLQRRGYYLEVAGNLFRGVDNTDSDFHRFRGVLTGFIPANPRQALALRAIAEVNKSDGGRGIPFTHLASLGDESGARAYRDGRFRDEAVLALMSEWRYEVWRELHERGRVESFLLLDSGTVNRRFSSMRLDELHWSFGFGFRVVWNNQVRWLVYPAFGDDPPRLNVNFSAIY